MAFSIHLGICTRSAISPKFLLQVKILSHTENTAENSAWNASSVVYKLLTHTNCLHVWGLTNVFFINTASVCIGTLKSPCSIKQTQKSWAIIQKQSMRSKTDQSALNLKKVKHLRHIFTSKKFVWGLGFFIRCKWQQSFVSLCHVRLRAFPETEKEIQSKMTDPFPIYVYWMCGIVTFSFSLMINSLLHSRFPYK